MTPYQKSKTLSERAARDSIAREGGSLEPSAVNPVAVLGPVLGPDYSHSIRLIPLPYAELPQFMTELGKLNLAR